MTLTRGLLGLLAIQALLGAATWWPRNDRPEPKPLIPFSEDSITKVQISSISTRSDNQDLVLIKTGKDWALESQFGYPADASKVSGLLERLTNLRIRQPLTVQKTAHKQLNVSDESPGRRVTLWSGDDEFTFLAGTATRGRMNVRLPGEDEVYEVNGMGSWEIHDRGSSFYDALIMKLEPSTLTELTLHNSHGDLHLVQQDSVWTSPDLLEGEALDPDQVQTFLKSVTTLRNTGPADPAVIDPRLDPDITVSWTAIEDGQSTTGSYVGKLLDQAPFVVQLDSFPHPFTTSRTIPRPLADTTLEQLTVSPPREP